MKLSLQHFGAAGSDVWNISDGPPCLVPCSHTTHPATLPPRARPMPPTRALGSGARRASPMPGVCALLHANLQLCCVHRMLLPGDPPSFLRTHFAAHCPITLPPTRSTHSPAILSRSGARRGGCPSCWWRTKERMVRTAGWECSASAAPSEPIRIGNKPRSSVELPRGRATQRQASWHGATQIPMCTISNHSDCQLIPAICASQLFDSACTSPTPPVHPTSVLMQSPWRPPPLCHPFHSAVRHFCALPGQPMHR